MINKELFERINQYVNSETVFRCFKVLSEEPLSDEELLFLFSKDIYPMKIEGITFVATQGSGHPELTEEIFAE